MLRRAALAVLLFLGLVAPAAAEERITRFVSDVQVNADASLDVTETIDVAAENVRINHGIFRDFPTRYKARNGLRVRVGFTLLGATRDGQPEPASTEAISNGVRIKIGSPQLTVGLIKGGINTNVVPDRVTFRLDRRMIPEENPAGAESELRSVIAEAAGAFPEARVEVRRILLVEPLAPLPGGERMTELLCRHASAVMGEPVRPKGVPLYTDAPHYASRGVPTALYGAGPRTIEEANAHRADERLPLSDLRKATGVVALTLLDLLTPGLSGR
jgi:acetylornithine deacetylase/succinyl-diaminopimelate desuccinylase-like protein